jgi:Chaperone of endosialidase
MQLAGAGAPTRRWGSCDCAARGRFSATIAGPAKLRPVSFRYTAAHSDREQRVQYGLIAEEVAEIYPELVSTNAQGEPTPCS